MQKIFIFWLGGDKLTYLFILIKKYINILILSYGGGWFLFLLMAAYCVLSNLAFKM